MKKMRTLCLAPLVIALGCFPLISQELSPSYPYRVAEKLWNEEWGNHRALMTVEKASVAELDFLWRRNDKNVDKRHFIIMNEKTGKRVENIQRIEVSPERCMLRFGPIDDSGTYAFYYLPYTPDFQYGRFKTDYLPQEPAPSEEWVNSVADKEPVKAKVLNVESRTKLDQFFPMAVVATQEEKKAYQEKHALPYWVFPEDRLHSIKTRANIPTRWLSYKQGDGFKGEAQPYEYYCYQLGVLSGNEALKNVQVTWSDLKQGEAIIPATHITCFNTEGIDPYGKEFTKTVTIAPEALQAFWMGVDIPRDVKPGTYTGTVTLSPEGLEARVVPVSVTITGDVVEDRGDANPYLMSRLRWLNSPIGIDDQPVKPYTPIVKDQKRLSVLGRGLELGEESPLPSQIIVGERNVLKEPIRFVIETSDGIKKLNATPTHQTLTEGRATWTWKAEDHEISLTCNAELEFDGWSHYTYTVHPKKKVSVKDIRLEIPMEEQVGKHIVGLGLPGQDTPNQFSGKWEKSLDEMNSKGLRIPLSPFGKKRQWPFDSFWMGSAQAGLHCELRGTSYSGPLLSVYHPPYPPAWNNEGKGGFYVERKEGMSLATIYSGARTLEADKPMDFEFALIVTPVKPIDYKSQFTDRYLHSTDVTKEYADAGVKIVNIHHATPQNPIINYPFLTAERIREFADQWREKGGKTKIYYTVRELASTLPELWALRSLGDEILTGGQGGGYTWLQEHIVDDYNPQWYTHISEQYPDITADASIQTATGNSRWLNYYLEGLAWLIKNAHIDGLYLDDVAYDRHILKRMRKTMESVKEGCILDLHSCRVTSACPVYQYTEFYPYINKLWFGESYHYDSMTPTNWLVESSGIPFGLMGDMLEFGGNRWLGMQYGMTLRPPWEKHDPKKNVCSPVPMWHLWDEFGIVDSRMMGFWEDQPPVTTSHPDVRATAYIKEGKTLVSVGNYTDEQQTVTLSFDANQLGLDLKKATLTFPEIKDFQKSQTLKPTDKITIKPREGNVFIIHHP